MDNLDENKKLIDLKKENYLKELKENHGVVGIAMRIVGIKSRQNLTYWRQIDPEFKKKENEIMLEAQSDINDLAEGKLFTAINQGANWAIKFWLETHHNDYKRKTTIAFENQEKIEEGLDELCKFLKEGNDKEDRQTN